MLKTFSTLLGGALIAALGALPALAQTTSLRTFVSGKGSDSGTCGITTPCRSFAYAINQTSAGGEIVVLDSAGYGSLTITKSIIISNPTGVEAGITASSGGTAITVNAGANDNVVLRGLSLSGAGVGQYGIVLNTGAHLDIVHCDVRGFTTHGIYINPSNMTTVGITDTIASDNGYAGIVIQNSATDQNFSTFATLTRVTVNNNGVNSNGYGVVIHAAAAAEIYSSSISLNNIDVDVTNKAQLNVASSSIGGFDFGLSINVDSSSYMYIKGSTVNGIQNNGVIWSYGDNEIGVVIGNSLQHLTLQ